MKKIIYFSVFSHYLFFAPLVTQASDMMMSQGHSHGNVSIGDKAIEVYGTVFMSIDHNNPGEGGQSNLYLDSGGTVLGIKGNSPLDSDLKFFWQIESTLDLTELGDKNKSELAGHDSFVGISGLYGNVLIGKHYTPYTLSTLAVDPFHHIAGDMGLLIGNVYNLNSGTGDHHGAAFNMRAPDILMYQSTRKNGFGARAAIFAFNETKKAPVTGDTSAFSLAGDYDVGPYYATIAYEQHKNYDSYGDHHGSVEVVDKASAAKLGIMYRIPKAMLAAVFDNIKIEDENSTEVPNESRNSYYLSAQIQVGESNTLKLAYGNASELITEDGGSFYVLGFFHKLSKVAQTYLSYVHTNNAPNAKFGTFRITPTQEGSDPTTISAGIMYAF